MAFSELVDVDVREAWEHEARGFTPWLANNIASIGSALNLSLEVQETEVAVGRFSADILARDLTDDSLVVIENQLESTDHSHLGQIMTYTAGLGASTVVWIAKSFNDQHLAVFDWLNENTTTGFRFFAARARTLVSRSHQ